MKLLRVIFMLLGMTSSIATLSYPTYGYTGSSSSSVTFYLQFIPVFFAVDQLLVLLSTDWL